MLHGLILRVVLVLGGTFTLGGLAGVIFLSLLGGDRGASAGRRYKPEVIASVFLLIAGLGLLGLGIASPLFGLFLDVKRVLVELDHTKRLALAAYQAQSEQAIRAILSEPRYQDPKRLNRHEYRVFSQNGEDGIIAEIFRRIGTTNRFFVEFGAADGFENNTVLLLRQGWSGLWIEGDPDLVARARGHFRAEIDGSKLTVMQAFITAENIEDLFRRGGVPDELDLLSIDIDRNDYYVWEKIAHYRPRAVVIEYNPLFPPTMSWVIPYDPQGMWDKTSRMGASLKALADLGSRNGYSLVGCSLAGANAFFVRSDLLGDHFLGPYTAENHYERSRYNLNRYDSIPDRVP
jgi:hypothetical protein